MERKAERNESSPPTVVTVGSVRFGRDPFPVIAGPSSVEDPDQVRAAARAVAEGGGAVLRGGTVTGSTYGFAGLGMAGLDMLAAAAKEVGLPVVTQVAAPGDVEWVSDRVDMLEVGAGNMQDFELLRAVGSSGKPVLLRRGPSATIDEWLWAAEYVLAGGNDKVVLVERGIRTFGDHGVTLDIGAIPMVKERSHLPVLVDPSGPAAGTSRVPPLALAAQGVGADGLIVEVHAHPDQARSGGPSQLDASGFRALMDVLGVGRMRREVDMVDRDIVRLLAERRRLAMAIGRVKAARGIPVYAPSREAELLEIIRTEAEHHGLDPDHTVALFESILEESRAAQRRARQE
ncbi:MAG TPA: chorismate mutase [Acidimicrobiia bacterium]|nr:chorismate mutase [Acidimicrobiia bacterium]